MSMDLRIPLSYVLDSPLSPRHAVPHRTLFLDATHPFVQYLDSDDTRLPQHVALTVEARPAEEYETYVGEDDWKKEETVDSDHMEVPPRFDDIVQWVEETLNKIGGDGDGNGVVLCGRCVVADDCGWAVFSRTPSLLSPQDVFRAMRNSPKFKQDIHHQLRGITSEKGETPRKVEVTLAKALGGDLAKEFRVFLPYRLRFSGEIPHVEVWEDHIFAGISQRVTDVCLPSLLTWDETTHETNYGIVMRHVDRATILERALDKETQLRRALLRHAGISDSAGDIQDNKKNFVLLLAVDVLFEGPTLPVHVLSAAVRCFHHNAEKDSICAFPFILETDAGLRSSTDSDSDNDEYGDSVSFFRLFRDVANWNRHVEVWCQGENKATTSFATGQSDADGKEKQRRFIVIASDHDDLVMSTESLAKRGVPLEFLRPDLFKGDANVLGEWRDKMMQNISKADQCRGD